MLDRAQEDVLALALADRADVGDDGLVVGEPVFPAHRRPGVGAGELRHVIEPDPARHEAEVSARVQVVVIGLRGAAEEKRAGGELERLRHQAVQLELELALEKAEDRRALVDVEERRLARAHREVHTPEAHEGVAHHEVDVFPIELVGDIADPLVKHVLSGCVVDGPGVHQRDVRAEGLEGAAQRTFLPGQHLEREAGLAHHPGGVFQEEEGCALQVEVVRQQQQPEPAHPGGAHRRVHHAVQAVAVQAEVRAQIRVAPRRVALHERDVLGVVKGHAARGAAPVHELRLRGVDHAMARIPHAEAVVYVVVGDAEVPLIKAAELFVERRARHQAGAGDGRDFPGGGVPLDRHLAGINPRERRVRQAPVRPDDDAGVVERLVGIDELGANHPDVRLQEPRSHFLQPGGLEGVHIVVQVQHERRVEVGPGEVDEMGVIERRGAVRRPHDDTAQVRALLDGCEVAHRVGVARVVVHDDQLHVPPVHRFLQQLDAFLQQV